MVVAVVARQAAAHILHRRLRQQGHAIVGLLAVHLDVVAKRFKGFARELLVDALDFLQAGDVRRGLLEPTQHGFQPGVDRIDVPGGDAHAPWLAPSGAAR
jgi:hypothetical protein